MLDHIIDDLLLNASTILGTNVAYRYFAFTKSINFGGFGKATNATFYFALNGANRYFNGQLGLFVWDDIYSNI